MLILSDIYKAISEKYPYYKNTTQNWQNSIRHNLSRDKSFTKAEVETRRGCFWKLANLKHLKTPNWKYCKLDNQKCLRKIQPKLRPFDTVAEKSKLQLHQESELQMDQSATVHEGKSNVHSESKY